ncbi:unnamed protein product [Effrenium voratum]|uniref:Uncharacterized protein n=1 Tax=Effrenium voratum TaxID=2562239 RepID=A0AA36HR55_9DINO|nr:unnamed protein product [Effrenium voratum]
MDGHGLEWALSRGLRTGFLPFDPEKFICAGGGAWYDCRLNKWGDKIVACEKWCGLPPIIPMYWHKTMFTDCEFENTHPDDNEFEPWRGWPFRGINAMEFQPNGGLPPDGEREITKICCKKPMPKCVTIGEPTVVVRGLPLAALPGGMPRAWQRHLRVRAQGVDAANFL